MVTDLHPEELVARAAIGALDDDERRRVRRHLRECESCRLELSVRRTAAEDASPRPGDARRLQRLAASAVARARAESARPVPHRFGMWTGVALGAAAGVVLMLTASLVLRWARVDERRSASHGMQAPSVVKSRAPSALRPEEAEATPKPGRAGTDEADVPVPTLERPTASLELPAPVRPTPRGPSAQPREPEPSVAAVPEPAPTPTPTTDAVQLFARATEATRRGDDEAALSAFEELRRRFPSSREAKASWVLAGRLQLDRSQPASALECFDHYLDAPGSAPLIPEALLGRATALQRLGREAEAREQHRDIVRRFPRSSAAMQARARLDGGESP